MHGLHSWRTVDTHSELVINLKNKTDTSYTSCALTVCRVCNGILSNCLKFMLVSRVKGALQLWNGHFEFLGEFNKGEHCVPDNFYQMK